METTNPGNVGDEGYEKAKFSDLNTGELFWLHTAKGDDNHAFRKISDTEAFNTKIREYVSFDRHKNVFYKM